ncbi:MAG: hypothetical protein IPI01_09545 [Ignavibacteriae bacterium]|nr:hypothetical protein [Ignavibacteriota bacterium]
MKTLGIILMVMGLIMTLYSGFNFVTKEKVVDLGPIEITQDNDHAIAWQPYVGVGAIIIGGILFVVSRKGSLAV